MSKRGGPHRVAAGGMGHWAEWLMSYLGPAIRNREQRAILSIRLGHGHQHPGLFVPMQGTSLCLYPPWGPQRGMKEKMI